MITTENNYKIGAMIAVCHDETAIQITANLAADELIRDIVEKTDRVLIILKIISLFEFCFVCVCFLLNNW